MNRAVRASTLPAPAKLIMLTLSDIADAGTAKLPPRRTPSTADLARETSLSVSTVKTHRKALEEAGWIVYRRPTQEQSSRHEPGTYRLAVPPSEGHLLAPASRRRGSAPDPRRGQHVTRAGVSSRPPAGSARDPLSNNDQNNDQEDHALRDTIERVCSRLADRIEANGTPRPPVTDTWRTTVAALIRDDGYDEERIGRAIDYAHSDTFWRIHITTPMALRAKWHDLRLSAEHARAREREQAARGGSVSLPPQYVPQNAPQRPAPADMVAEARARAAESRTSVHAANARQQQRTTDPRQEP